MTELSPNTLRYANQLDSPETVEAGHKTDINDGLITLAQARAGQERFNPIRGIISGVVGIVKFGGPAEGGYTNQRHIQKHIQKTNRRR